jgi:hypothetical protein
MGRECAEVRSGHSQNLTRDRRFGQHQSRDHHSAGATATAIDDDLELRHGLMSLIREESIKAMGGELNDLALDGLSIDLHDQSLADVL